MTIKVNSLPEESIMKRFYQYMDELSSFIEYLKDWEEM